MTKTIASSAKRRARTPNLDLVVKRVLRSGGTDFRFPVLSGDEAAELMRVAGIVDKNGKLAKKYR
jgi:hypothetical protein